MTGVVDPTWTWGSSASLEIINPLGGAGGVPTNSAQLAQVTLPEPAVCSLYMQATVRSDNPAQHTVGEFTMNLIQGVGRVAVPRTITFSGQPSVDGPLEWTMPFVMLHSLQVDITATGEFADAMAGQLDLQVYFIISPITRIPQKVQELKFGMQLPGEADALDDELREDLEEESPTTQEVMSQEAHHRVHGDDGDDDGGDEPQQAPAWMLELVEALSQRLGRLPKRSELRMAVKRLRERQARRAR
jgi:hypothetical protein